MPAVTDALDDAGELFASGERGVEFALANAPSAIQDPELGLPGAAEVDEKAALAAPEAVARLVRQLGLPDRLSQVGLNEQDRPDLVKAVQSVGATPEQADILIKEMF